MPGAGPTRWGYHRLSDRAARRLVSAAGVLPADLVLDLGAGEGALTRHLARAGAQVVAIELHPDRYERLVSAMAGRPRVRAVRADLVELRWPRRPFKVVANPPYAASASLIRSLTRRNIPLVSADLVLPWFVVRRWVRRPPPGWMASAGLRLPPSSFRPAATDDAAVLRLRRPEPGPPAGRIRRR